MFLRILVVLLTALLGAFAALIAVFHMVGLQPAALIATVVIAVLVWAFLVTRRKRALTLVLVLIPVLIIALFIGSTLRTMYTLGQLALPVDDRVANYDRLWEAMRDTYPYFDIKPVDWQAVREPYRERVAAAANEEEYFAVIAELLGTLQDSHTSLSYPYTIVTFQFARLMVIDGQYVIRSVYGTDAIAVGEIVTAINGEPVEARIAALPADYRIGSTAANTEALSAAAAMVLFGDETSMDVTVIGVDGTERTITLTLPEEETGSNDANAPEITGTVQESGYGLIRIPSFGGSRAELVAEFDAALAALGDVPGIILDARSNGGGNSLTASEMAGRFMNETFAYAQEFYRQRMPDRFWLSDVTRVVSPRAPYDDRPLVILTDARVVSSAEEFVLMLVDSGRAVSIGRTTAGGTGNPIGFLLADGGEASFSTGDLHRVDGSRLEGAGIAPAISVTWTLDDVREGRDPDIAAAEAYLSGLGE